MLFLRLKLCRKSNFHNSFFKDYLQTITNNCCLSRSDCSMIICQMLCVFCWISVWIPVLYRKLALKRFQPLRRAQGCTQQSQGVVPPHLTSVCVSDYSALQPSPEVKAALGGYSHHGLNNVGLRDARWRDPAAMLLVDVGTRTWNRIRLTLIPAYLTTSLPHRGLLCKFRLRWKYTIQPC